MGCRLHSATTYEVAYNSKAVFNWASNRINPIIECLSDGDFWCDEQDCIEGAKILEGNRENLLKNVEHIINPNPEWENQEVLDELIEEMENDEDCDIDKEYLYTNLKNLIENADTRCDYVHFSWF